MKNDETKFDDGPRVSPEEAEARAREKAQSNNGAEPDWAKPKSFDELERTPPTELIRGIFYGGGKMGVAAGSKSLKTWLLLHLTYCLANGLKFLGYPTKKICVGYFDFELPEFAIRHRLGLIRAHLGGQGTMENIKIWALRGKVRKFRKDRAKFVELVSRHAIDVAIIDPLYKFLIGQNENDNSIVADLLEDLAEYCDLTGVAVIYVHHHSKGNQSGKEAIDRTSGAGTWGRDPDTLLDLTEHEDSTPQETILTAEFITRLFEKPDKFVVRWEVPVLVRDDGGLNPEDLKQPKRGGRPKKDLAAEILAILRMSDSEGGATSKALAESTLTTIRTVQRRLKELMPEKVTRAPAINGYQLALAERNQWEEFKKTMETEE